MSEQDARPSWLAIGWSTLEQWTQHMSAVVAAAIVGAVLVLGWLDNALDGWASQAGALTLLGLLLVAYAVARAIVAIFGAMPATMTDRGRSDVWRITWAVGALSLVTLLLASLMFTLNDRMRLDERGHICARETGETGGAADAAAGPALDVAPRSTVDATLPADVPTTELPFGFDRGVRSTSFTVAVVEGRTSALSAGDFQVLSDDGRIVKRFANVASVTPLGGTEALVRLEVDLSCHSAMEGGKFGVRTVYVPATADKPILDRQSWQVDVTLQSRLLFYFLALVPIIVVGAMFQAFSMWPSSMKRWFTSVVAIVVPVLTAYKVAGLSNTTWHHDPLALAGLFGATYVAAVTAANLVKNGGHDLDQPAPAASSPPTVPTLPDGDQPADTAPPPIDPAAGNGHQPREELAATAR